MNENNVAETAQWFLFRNRVMDALGYTADYVASHSSETEGWYWRGIALIFARKYPAALMALERGELLGANDTEILFGLGAIHYTLGNYQLGGQYIGRLMAAFDKEESDEQLCGRACMLAAGGAFNAAILFIEYINTHCQTRSASLDECAMNIHGDQLNYAFKEKPRLGESWLTLHGINPDQKDEIKKLVMQLVGELSWSDAAYLYKRHLCERAATCPSAGDNACLNCLSRVLFPPPHMFCPNLFINPGGK